MGCVSRRFSDAQVSNETTGLRSENRKDIGKNKERHGFVQLRSTRTYDTGAICVLRSCLQWKEVKQEYLGWTGSKVTEKDRIAKEEQSSEAIRY